MEGETIVRDGNRPRGLGAWGEALVARDLARQGWRIVARNYRCRFGELDIVAEKGGILAFVEVKLRKNDRCGPARAYVTADKQRRLRITAEHYLQSCPTDLQPRFDVAEVYAPVGELAEKATISYIENAF